MRAAQLPEGAARAARLQPAITPADFDFECSGVKMAKGRKVIHALPCIFP
jgi:hypothetical protein